MAAQKQTKTTPTIKRKKETKSEKAKLDRWTPSLASSLAPNLALLLTWAKEAPRCLPRVITSSTMSA